MKIHITHTDLDGAGSDVIFQRAYGKADKFYSVNHPDPASTIRRVLQQDICVKPSTVEFPLDGEAEKNIAEIKERLKANENELVLWITDLAPQMAELDMLRELQDRFKLFDDLFVCDHHPTSDWLALEKYQKFAVWKQNQCGTMLAYYYALGTGRISPDAGRDFAYAVDAYDRWQLDSEHRKRGENLQKLFRTYGFQRFVNHMVRDIDHDQTSRAQELIEIADEKEKRAVQGTINKLVDKADKHIKVDQDGNRYVFSLGNAQGHTSSLGHAMLDTFKSVGYAAIVSADGIVSLRSRSYGVDVGAIAKRNGGGGHKGAAGFRIEVTDMFRFVLGLVL